MGSKGAIGAEDDEGAEGAEGFVGAEEDEGFEGAEEDDCELQCSERFVCSSSNYNVDNNNMFASDTEWGETRKG